jgi:hypothetical protein
MKIFPLTIYVLLTNLLFKFYLRLKKKLVGFSHYGHFRHPKFLQAYPKLAAKTR